MSGARTYYALVPTGAPFEIVVENTGDVCVTRDGASWMFQIERSADNGRVLVDGRPRWFDWRPSADGFGRLTLDDAAYDLEILGVAQYRTRAAKHVQESHASYEVRAPMPGMLLELSVSDGDQVKTGQPLAIIEAMKMENEINAPVAGLVTGLAVTVGAPLEQGALLCRIEPEPAP